MYISYNFLRNDRIAVGFFFCKSPIKNHTISLIAVRCTNTKVADTIVSRFLIMINL